jgi:SEC-C motif-containing protein
MRSRFAAFAKKEVAYLERTLHPEHEDRKHLTSAQIQHSIRETSRDFRYLDLAVLDHADFDETGTARVLFFAKVFSKGADFSFAELSEFRRDGEGIRYLRGEARPMRGTHDVARALTFATWKS